MLAQTTHQHPKLAALTQGLVDQSREATFLSTQEKGWLIRASHALKEARKPYQVQIDNNPKEGLLPESFDYTVATLQKNPVLKNTGTNTLYYALTLEGEPVDVKKLPQSGFELTRNVYTLDGTEAALDKIKSGELYVVHLRGRKQDESLNHILLVDMLPAGFEIDNANLAQDFSQVAWLGNLTQAARLEGRDDRFMAAFTLAGQTEFSAAYIARAVSKGSFAYPPAMVEAMYQPQFFAYSDEQKIQVLQ